LCCLEQLVRVVHVEVTGGFEQGGEDQVLTLHVLWRVLGESQPTPLLYRGSWALFCYHPKNIGKMGRVQFLQYQKIIEEMGAVRDAYKRTTNAKIVVPNL